MHSNAHPGQHYISSQTPQGGYHVNTIDHGDGARINNPHRRGNSNNLELGRSPGKANVSLKYANHQYGKSGDLAHQRANARSQLSGAVTNQKTNNNLVAQSLDPARLQMAKRKASNDEGRFKNIQNRFTGGVSGGYQPNT